MEEMEVSQDFEVEIVETLSKIVKVKAKNEDEALGIVSQRYKKSVIVLDSEDYVNTEFKIFSNNELEKHTKEVM